MRTEETIMFPSLRQHSPVLRVAIAAFAILVSTSACSTESKIKRHMERGDAYLAEDKQQEAIIEFGELVAGAARPIDDHRSTARYRKHAVEVMARRALMRCL
jgi:hypothetical protein